VLSEISLFANIAQIGIFITTIYLKECHGENACRAANEKTD